MCAKGHSPSGATVADVRKGTIAFRSDGHRCVQWDTHPPERRSPLCAVGQSHFRSDGWPLPTGHNRHAEGSKPLRDRANSERGGVLAHWAAETVPVDPG